MVGTEASQTGLCPCSFLICPVKRHLERLSKGVPGIELSFPKINLAKSKRHRGLKWGWGKGEEMNVSSTVEAKSMGGCLDEGNNAKRKVKDRMPRFHGWGPWNGDKNKDKEQRRRADLGEEEMGSVGG